MRALTIEELGFVSGGETVVVTAQRRDELALATWDRYFTQQSIFAGLDGITGVEEIGLPTEDLTGILPQGFEKYGDGNFYMRNIQTGAITLTPSYAAAIIAAERNGYYVNWGNVAVTLGIAATAGAGAVTGGATQQIMGVANTVLNMVGIRTSGN